MEKLPHIKKPCRECPFRKDSRPGWLGEGVVELLAADSFVCHKTIGDKSRQQCAGHMLINGMDNGFVRLAARLRTDLDLSGRELVFDSTTDCIEHHKRPE